jgi:hypothetical protein
MSARRHLVRTQDVTAMALANSANIEANDTKKSKTVIASRPARKISAANLGCLPSWHPLNKMREPPQLVIWSRAIYNSPAEQILWFR